MKKILIVIAVMAFFAMGLVAQFALGGTPNNSGNKVTICHATGSKTNPYVEITPDASGVISGHYAHQDKRDIIPPFDYYDSAGVKHHFAGQNWTAENEAILKNHCKALTSTTTTTTTTTPVVTTTPSTTQTVTTVIPTPGPSTTVTVTTPAPLPAPTGKTKKKVTVIKKVHVQTISNKKPKTTG